MKLWQGVCKNKMAKMRLQMLSGSGNREYLLPFALSLLLLSIFVLRFLTSSFWLDETMTYWVIKNSFVDAVHRSIHFQGPGPLHYLVAWMFKTLLGSSEPAIRLPSLLAFVALCSVFYKLTCLVFDRRLALLSVAVMLSLSGIAEVAIVARTYSLSLLIITLSSLMLVRWGGGGGGMRKSHIASAIS